VSDWHPHVTVATVVERSGRFLLVREYDPDQSKPGDDTSTTGLVINQPAGHLDEHENLLQAAIRETLEETGWHVTLDAYIGTYLYRSPFNQVTYIRHAFAATAVEQVTEALDDGIEAAVWMTRDEMEQSAQSMRSPMVIRLVDDYIAGKRYPLEMVREIHE
jgi:8-oxo-dGTP pyrophosphatase MutT (NUDIX family)